MNRRQREPAAEDLVEVADLGGDVPALVAQREALRERGAEVVVAPGAVVGAEVAERHLVLGARAVVTEGREPVDAEVQPPRRGGGRDVEALGERPEAVVVHVEVEVRPAVPQQAGVGEGEGRRPEAR